MLDLKSEVREFVFEKSVVVERDEASRLGVRGFVYALDFAEQPQLISDSFRVASPSYFALAYRPLQVSAHGFEFEGPSVVCFCLFFDFLKTSLD